MKHLKSSAYSPVSTNIMGQSLIYDHMSHHYRRLYNAKARVDCSPPRHMRAAHGIPLKTGCNITPDHMALVDQLVYDNKLGPSAYCSQCCSTPHGPPPSFANLSQSPASWKKPAATRNMQAVNLELKPAEGVNRHINCFESPTEKPFKPRILKSNTQSKLRDLRVYHPPRRKPQKRRKVVEKNQVPEEQTEVPEPISAVKEEDQVDDGISSASSAGPWLQMSLYMEYPCPGTTQKSTSEESSRDSAYNGGVSSAGESRGSSPEQSPEKPPVPPVHLTPAMEARLKRQKEEALYVQFVHDITQDVLDSGIFSNKGLRQVFQRHISLNRDKLEMNRMKAEVAKLQLQLDMPDDEDDTFPMPSREDIVLSWPSNMQYAQDVPQAPVSSSLESRTDRMIRPSLESTTGSQFNVEVFPTTTRLDNEIHQIVHSSLESVTESIATVEGFGTAEEREPSPKSKMEMIQSLVDMGFAATMAEEIYQSLSERDLHHPRLSDMRLKTTNESKIPSKKSSARAASPMLSSIEEITERSDPPSACYCSYSPPARDTTGRVVASSKMLASSKTTLESTSGTSELISCSCLSAPEAGKSSNTLGIDTTSSGVLVSVKSGSSATFPTNSLENAGRINICEETAEHSDPPGACYCSYSPVECMPAGEISNTMGKVSVSTKVSVKDATQTNSTGNGKTTGSNSLLSEKNGNDSPCDSEPTSCSSSISEQVEELLTEANADRSSEVGEEDDMSFVEEECRSEAQDEDESIREELSEDCSTSNDSSVTHLAEQLRSFTVEKSAFYPSSFHRDQTDRTPREGLVQEYHS